MPDNRILCTHAGSLPRPAKVKALLTSAFVGEDVSVHELDEAVAQATADALQKQRVTGIDIVNNGEQGRESFFTYIQHRMSGFGGVSERAVMRDTVAYPGYRERMVKTSRDEKAVNLLAAPRALAEIRYTRPKVIEAECQQFRHYYDLQIAAGASFTDGFMSAPSPGIIAAAMNNDYYPDQQSYVSALAAALKTEYDAIHRAGFMLQIDAPDLALERHTSFADKPLSDFIEFIAMVITAINDALRDVPRDRVRLHVCWGNYEGPHDHDVALSDIYAELIKTRAGALMLSMANPRHAHEYHCFETQKLPDDMSLIVGAIDTTTNYVEHPLAVADRLMLAAGAVGDPSRIMAGTDCGFETSTGVSFVVEEIAWAKLRALAEGATIAGHKLFG